MHIDLHQARMQVHRPWELRRPTSNTREESRSPRACHWRAPHIRPRWNAGSQAEDEGPRCPQPGHGPAKPQLLFLRNQFSAHPEANTREAATGPHPVEEAAEIQAWN